jgi:flagellin FlaB
LKTNRDVQSKDNDTLAAIGIGAMIVFIALILVAAVAAAVIIQTAEKLQQNAQTAGDDTADEMGGKLMINAAYVGTGSATANTDEYHLLLRLGPGSEPTLPSALTYQVFCANGVVEGELANTDVHTMEDEADLAAATTQMNVGEGYIVYIDATSATVDCGPDAVTTAELYLHVERGGTTYETLTIDDTSPGALVV